MRTSLVLALAFAGCATTGSPADKQLLDEKTEQTAAAEAAPSTPPAPHPTPTVSKEPGTITRGELMQVLDAAPGAFLQHVDSQPRFRAGHFVGWKLVSFYPGDNRFAGIDLRAGDTVTKVNGSSIERPEQLMDVWTQLRTSAELVIDLERDGKPRTLRWTISP